MKNASLKEASNRAAMKLRYSRGVKERQLEVVVAFLYGNDVFAVFLLRVMHACLLLSSCLGRLREANCGGSYFHHGDVVNLH